MNHDTSSNLRQGAAIGIMALAALVTAFLVVWAVVQNQPISPIADTLGGILVGFATHELGVSRGASLTQTTPAAISPALSLEEPDHVTG